MAWRNIDIALRADTSQYEAGMRRASGATSGLGATQQRTVQQSRANMDMMGRGAVLMGGAMLAGFGVAVRASLGFEKQISELGAVSGATASEMGALRQATLDAGAATVFSAGEAAGAATELAKAGVTTADILGGGLAGALDLAAAGNLGLARAAELSAAAMNTFGLEGADVPRIADTLAAAANKSAADVDDLGMALQQSGLVADQFGITLEETSGVLAMFSQAGLNGSDAGTSFKTMLQRLVPQSVEAKNMMDDLGLSFFEANGEFVGIAEVAEQLRSRLGGLSDQQRATALSTLFGSDAVRGATILMEGGASAVERWTGNVTDAGYASDLAAQKLDNLAGDLEALKGSIETTLIQGGSQANGVLREMVQRTTDLVNGIGGLPAPVLAAGTGIAGLGGGALALGGAVVYLTPKVQAAREALAGMGAAGQSANMWIGRLAPAAAGAALLLGAVAMELGRIDAEIAALVGEATEGLDLSTVEGLGSAVENLADQIEAVGEESSGGFWNFSNWANREAPEQARRIDQLNAEMERLVFNQRWVAAEGRLAERNMQMLTSELGLSEDQILELADAYEIDLSGALADVLPAMEGAKAEARANVEATGELTSETEGLTEALGGLSEAEKEAQEQHEKWLEALEESQDAFVTPMQTFNEMLQDNAQSMADNANELNEWWNATHEGTDRAALSWEDFADRASVSIDDYIANLEKQVEAQSQWRTNLVTIAQRGGEELASELATWGPEAAGLIQAMANSSNSEFERMGGLIRGQMQNTSANVARELAVMAEIGRSGGQRTADEIARTTGSRVEDVRLIAFAYGVRLAEGINPVLRGVGASPVNVYAAAEGHEAMVASPGDWRVWAEPETGGEAYIPLAQSKRLRSTSILRSVADRFGYSLVPQGYADYQTGGFWSTSAVPQPPSTSAYGNMAGYSGAEAMGHMRGEVVDYLSSLFAAPAGASASGLNPLLLASFNAWNSAMDGIYSIVSGFRSIAQQAQMYSDYINGLRGYTLVAPPGQSNHNFGLAIDHSPHSTASSRAVGYGFGLHWPVPAEPWHVERIGMPRGYTPFRYDQGGWLPEGLSLAYNGTGAPEPVGMPNVIVNARVFVGNREITDIARVEATAVVDGAARDFQRGRKMGVGRG